MTEPFVVKKGSSELRGERWPGGDPVVVLLHEGVSDRRGWADVAAELAPTMTVVAYDRRGYGETAVSPEPFSHAEDLVAVLGEASDGPAWLVGASAGGGVALDTALLAPERVAGLVLIGTAVSGGPGLDPGDFDQDTLRFDELLDEAASAGDIDEVNRLETSLWLDGPAGPEGRVSGPARTLALDMNSIILRNGAREDEGESGIDAWERLAEVSVPVTVACGALDVPVLIETNRALAGRLPNARFELLPGMAHQPYLERPHDVAQLVRHSVAGR